MKLLMHICCGPCAIYPLKELRTKGFEVTGLFYNPNIHPYREYKKRGQTLKDYAQKSYFNVIWPPDYPMEEFIRQTAFKGKDRCVYCVTDRLKYTAKLAANDNYDAFTTTLLYSIYQRHDLIREIGEDFSRQLGTSFYYQDFRVGWSEGVKISREMALYRQPYCGCIYSEKERYLK
ncbi:MAG: epoxyqueuosine reductase QueH [Smithellaceae bacterium]|jgi:predicted adenine nucleotide alpha hydrolase (AANH) superfamily ATPase|nr:epoxyqueuosine reductase QueH [Smithellaceae bacterium]HPW23560.1 epoxyqueuosine reductase QueH [Smithellaceae bacterium]